MVLERPWLTWVWIERTPGMPAMESSIGRLIWVSISAGAAPLSVTVTAMAGKTTLGNCLIGRKP